MKIIETCPDCSAEIQDIVICTYPEIPGKFCPACGWSWTPPKPEEDEDVIRIPFTPPVRPYPVEWVVPTVNPVPRCCQHCSNHPSNGGSGICMCTLPYFSGEGIRC